ncbi:hypothetical protein ABID23_000376 [Bartonella silvatica]|uniref:Uncharacterized protein n=1 Tax=Bartonella silvatica TaxID=357760 RepID=A0ABV2HFS0_9HYPH
MFFLDSDFGFDVFVKNMDTERGRLKFTINKSYQFFLRLFKLFCFLYLCL